MIYRIITKILVNRLKTLLPKLISTEQDGFVKGQQIIDGIITMHETLHTIKGKKEETMCIKLDM